MGAALAHRGPDGDGTRTASGATLGCRRLAIIDVAGGAQPLSNEAGDVIAVCNGEIYNHATLRERLVARGHHFRTHSDAEVLPHLYEEHGPDLVSELEGMFALRDLGRASAPPRAGPRSPGREAALPCRRRPAPSLRLGAQGDSRDGSVCAPEPDWGRLGAYLCQGYVPWPASAFAAIEKLPPGGRLVREVAEVREDRYWEAASWCAAPALDVDLPHGGGAAPDRARARRAGRAHERRPAWRSSCRAASTPRRSPRSHGRTSTSWRPSRWASIARVSTSSTMPGGSRTRSGRAIARSPSPRRSTWTASETWRASSTSRLADPAHRPDLPPLPPGARGREGRAGRRGRGRAARRLSDVSRPPAWRRASAASRPSCARGWPRRGARLAHRVETPRWAT